jgi:hypothetical protein
MKQQCLTLIKYSIIILIGVVFRWILFNSSYQKTIESRVEVSTPFTSWIRGSSTFDLLDQFQY